MRWEPAIAAANDGLRALIGALLAAMAPVLELLHRRRVRRFAAGQRRLRLRYGVRRETPIRGFDASVEAALGVAARGARIAHTSGSTAAPKRVAYTRRRIRAVKAVFSEVYVRACRAHGIRRKSLFVVGPLDPAQESSLTSLLLEERGLSPYLATLQAPYRALAHPAFQELAARYGAAAVRLWAIALSNPGVIYATNPSTIAAFFDAVATDWPAAARFTRDFVRSPESFARVVRSVARRLASRGARERLAVVATSDESLPVAAWAPALEAFICWTGGYTGSFVARLAAVLPPPRYRLIPMYSMATETIATVTHFAGAGAGATEAFLPLAPFVLYEFLPEGAADRPELLIEPGALEIGRAYTLVVSDAHGLRRYQTEDVFLCAGKVADLPDLRFLRRRGLAYSFTGEKLTGEQVTEVIARLLGERPALAGSTFLGCVPSHPEGDRVPHYKLLVVGGPPSSREEDGYGDDALGERTDALLGEVNAEYHEKRRSGRLGCARVLRMTASEHAARRRDGAAPETPSQQKVLPLEPRLWEGAAGTVTGSQRPRPCHDARLTMAYPSPDHPST